MSIAVLFQLTSIISAYMSAGIPFTAPLMKTIAQGVIAGSGSEWQPSLSWVKQLFNRLELTWRVGTKAAKKTPPQLGGGAKSIPPTTGLHCRDEKYPQNTCAQLGRNGDGILSVTKQVIRVNGGKGSCTHRAG